jgi:dihydroorotate dehydrogenase (NAD+) catalytic subunit
MTSNRLEVPFLGKTIKNPIVAASGCYGYGLEQPELLPPEAFGAITLKGLSASPKRGNPPRRIAETPCGMLNSIGLENVGIEAFAKNTWPHLRGLGVPIIANFFGDDETEFQKAAQMLSDLEGLFAMELNLSCPNKPQWRRILASDPKVASRLVRLIKPLCRYPLIVKLSPNVASISEVAKACEDSGADALSLINTLLGMAIDVDAKSSRLGTRFGGLSGPSIYPIALRMDSEVSRAVRIPIVGMGGVSSPEDAIGMMLAGASLVGVGTLLLVNPFGVEEIKQGMLAYLDRHGLEKVACLQGRL